MPATTRGCNLGEMFKNIYKRILCPMYKEILSPLLIANIIHETNINKFRHCLIIIQIITQACGALLLDFRSQARQSTR